MIGAKKIVIIVLLLLADISSYAQDAKAGIRLDPPQILVGDQARLFIEVQNNEKAGKLQWAAIPDTFNNLEVIERGKIDTLRQGDVYTYKQRVIITGFDSGVFKIPAFQFSVIHAGNTASIVQTDSLQLLVQTVAVDTTQPIKPIKGIILVKSSWLDYIWYFIGAAIFIILLVFVIIYFIRNKKAVLPVINKGPVETLQEKTLRLLAEVEAQKLWEKGQVKEYYVQVTDVLRNYIEARFNTAALELTTDELLESALRIKEMLPYRGLLGGILYTADLAKFAKSEPLPAEHIATMEQAKEFVNLTTPPPVQTKEEK